MCGLSSLLRCLFSSDITLYHVNAYGLYSAQENDFAATLGVQYLLVPWLIRSKVSFIHHTTQILHVTGNYDITNKYLQLLPKQLYHLSENNPLKI